MSAGERLLLYRATIRARFPIFAPLPVILPDVPSGPNVRFVELDRYDRDVYEAAATFWIDWLRAAHEHGHALEALVILRLARRMGWTLEGAKDYLRRSFYAFRGIESQWQADVEAANAMGEQGRQAFHPVELVAESVAHALGATWNDQEQRYKERTIADIYPVDPAAMLAWWQAIMREAGVTLPALQYRPSPNFGTGRELPIRYIVLHTTQGYDSRSWLTNPASQVSAHYLERDDDEYQLVDEENTAWHAGRIVARRTPTGRPTTPLYVGQFLGFTLDGQERWSVNPNDESIGIEMEGFAAELLSPTIIGRTAARIRTIRAERGPLELVDHAQLSPGDRSDPGWQNHAAVQAALEEDVLMAEIGEQRLREIIREEVTDPLNKKIDSGINTTIAVMLRRTARWIVWTLSGGTKGAKRDPAGDTSTGTPKAYPDDMMPLS